MTLHIAPSGQACGARVTGVDLAGQIDPATVAQIRTAWLEHHVLVFPDQPMTDDDLERFTLSFGGASHTTSACHGPARRSSGTSASREFSRNVRFVTGTIDGMSGVSGRITEGSINSDLFSSSTLAARAVLKLFPAGVPDVRIIRRFCGRLVEDATNDAGLLS